MKSLDEAVEKFRVLKEKLRNISQQSSKQTPTFPKSNKENLKNTQNLPNPPSVTIQYPHKEARAYSKQKDGKEKVVGKQKQKKGQGKENENLITLEDDNIDNKIQTQKKANHRKNKSCNFSNKQIISETRDSMQEPDKLSSLNNSRLSETLVRKQLTQKEKTLGEINDLLQRKKQVLEALQKKLGHSFLEDSKYENVLAKSKHSIRAPNLFQMQAEGRKRSKSKTLTIRWK